jgi:small subunit ribosomal protein S3
MKRHNVFFNFLKQALIVFVMSSLSNVDGIKILIKGRLNGVPRAKKKLILVGNVTTQKIEKNLDYSETTSYTTNGTFGVKVWISEKIK